MKHVKLDVRLAGLCLAALFALGALVASAAQAETTPEWGRCLHIVPSTGKEQKKGNYTEANCQTVAVKVKENKKTHEKTETPDHKGGYEWFPGAGPLCEKQTEGKYTYKEKECKTEDFKENKKTHTKEYKGKYEKTGGGKFEANAGAGVLTATIYECNTGAPNYERVQRPRSKCPFYSYNTTLKVECASEHATGEATGTSDVTNVSVRFKGCTIYGIPTNSHGLTGGEIQLNQLNGKLGYINKSATPEPDVGVLLEPATAGGIFTEFEVEGIPLLTVVGEGNATTGSFYEETGPGVPTGNDGVISPITPINKMAHTFTQVYATEEISAPEKEVRNVPSHFEGGHNELLETYLEFVKETPEEAGETFAWSPAGEELTNTNTLLEGEAEIKA